MVDTANVRLGVGKCIPSQTLDVNGAELLSGNLTFNSGVTHPGLSNGNLVFTDASGYHNILFKSTGSVQGWPIGEIQFVQQTNGIHRIISFDSQDSASPGFPGILDIGVDPNASGTGFNGVVINGNYHVTPDLYVSTHGWVSIGSIVPAANGSNNGLWVAGNIVSTGTVSAVTYFGDGSNLIGISSGSFAGGIVPNETDFQSSVTVSVSLTVGSNIPGTGTQLYRCSGGDNCDSICYGQSCPCIYSGGIFIPTGVYLP